MTTSLKIKDVAERSGFTPATLRYYEQIGLLPATARTQSGYRQYDDRTLDRLAFIARAKRLGCTLEEIADLSIAWDGGQCGPVQDRLRSVVADKISAAQQQLVELMTLTAELQHAGAELERHRPDGPCDDHCGCVAEPAAVQQVSMTTKPAPTDQPAIACTLAAADISARLSDWNAVLAHAVAREPLAGGVRVVLTPTAPLGEVVRLVAAEHECCRFFDFALIVDGRGPALEVRAPCDAQPLLDSVFGVAP